jgi:hypothetical protein
MNTCTRCPAPARWRDADGRQFCFMHIPHFGKGVSLIPAPPEPVPDIVERLETVSGDYGCPTVEDLCREAAAEIRRLRALLEPAGDKSGSC